MDKLAEKNGLKCQFIAKCDFFENEKVGDKISNKLIERAEKSGRLLPTHIIIHPVLDDKDLHVVMTARIRGYRTIVVITDKKKTQLRELEILGTEIITSDNPVEEAKRLNLEIANSHVLKLQDDISPVPFYGKTSVENTVREVMYNFNKNLDMIVLAAAPGNDELVRKLKETWPNLIVVGVIPYSATKTPLDGPEDKLHEFHLNESLEMVHSLLNVEGIACGPDSGSIMLAAQKEAKNLNGDQICLAILPDTIHGGSFFLNKWWPVWNKQKEEQERSRKLEEAEKSEIKPQTAEE